jgi:two-component sensor histidine kinase/CheY-like chemotaxis protein
MAANILLVDDEPRNLTALESILTAPEYNLVKAQSGEDALMALLRQDFAVIVLDINMPRLNGLEIAHLIKNREKTRHIPIIFLTAYYQEDKHAIEGYSAGAVDYLHKPVNPVILRSKVGVFVELTQTAALRAELAERQRNESMMKAALQEKEVLLKEIHHRVKNNLQVISSLLNLQSERLKNTEAQAIFQESQTRVRSMAMIHEKLYQSDSISRVDFGEYIASLTSMLHDTYAEPRSDVRVETCLDPVFLEIDTAVPLALIINELVSNCLKYAYPRGQSGVVWLSLRAAPDSRYRLTVRDEGAGLPAGFVVEKAGTLGLQLVGMLSQQLRGELSWRSNSHGTEFNLVFPA